MYQKLFMKYLLLPLFILNHYVAKPQSTQYPFDQLYKLDSIGRSNSISKHFGKLYFTFLGSIEEQITPCDSVIKTLIRRFEAVFAQFYIDACMAYEHHQPINTEDWEAYFSATGLQPIQYKLLGTNAHLNGRLWEAHANSFTLEEMNMLKKEFIIFKKTLNKTYRLVYKEAATETKRIALLNRFTWGIDRLVGYYYLYKWRNRQMKLARLYLSGASRFAKLLAKVNRQREKINTLIFKLK